MKIENYEKNYRVAKDAEAILSKIKPIVEFMAQHANETMTCREIGESLYGDNYNSLAKRQNWYEMQANPQAFLTPQKLGNILSHLVQLGYVQRVQIDGEPREITHDKYIQSNRDIAEPYYLEVTDQFGRKFKLPNPNYHPFDSGHWETVTETITPKINAYIWVGGEI